MADEQKIAKFGYQLGQASDQARSEILIKLFLNFPEQIIEKIEMIKTMNILEGKSLGRVECSWNIPGYLPLKTEMNRAELDDIEVCIRQGKKVEAIKLLRTISGWGLKEAKDAVEGMHYMKWKVVDQLI